MLLALVLKASFGLVLLLVAMLGVLFFAAVYNYVTKPKQPKQQLFVRHGQVKRVAVIGAGASGITAAKEALSAGFEVDVFEFNEEIGGTWVYREYESNSSVMRSTFINTSRQLMTFSDCICHIFFANTQSPCPSLIRHTLTTSKSLHTSKATPTHSK
jgi:monoamine oxidase